MLNTDLLLLTIVLEALLAHSIPGDLNLPSGRTE